MDDILEISQEEQQSLRDRVYTKLKQAIADGVFPSGSRLVESDLADRLKVSRTPVREALQRLAREGLVTVLPRKGVIIESLSLKDLEEIFLLREVLEGLAGSLAAQRIDEAQLELLRKNVDASHKAAKSKDLEEAIRLNAEFHSLVISAARSPRLAELLDVVMGQISNYRRISMSGPGRPKTAAEEHTKILDAIQQNNPEEAEASLRLHASNAREVVIEMAKSREG